MVGAGLSGLACALYLRAAGREVTLLEQRSTPGSCLEIDGFRFDTGPLTPLTRGEIAAPFRALGEHLADWLELLPLETICRAHYPDGTTLDVHTDPHRTAEAIGALCGGSEARAYRRMLKLRLPAEVALTNPRTLRLFGCSSLFGFNVLAMAWHPRGGSGAIAHALAALAEKLGITLRLNTLVHGWETRNGRVSAAHTAEGERLPADSFVVPGDRLAGDARVFPAQPHLPAPNGHASGSLLDGSAPSGPAWLRRPPRGPSHLVIHLGTATGYSRLAHHNLHFGKPWQRSRHEILQRGELMTDPTILVSAPWVTDRTVGRHYYRVTVPVPNLRRAPLAWDGPATRSYAGEILATLEARGYLDLGAGRATSYVVTPVDWSRQGLPYGIQHNPRKHRTKLHSSLSNVVIAGSGLTAGRTAAEKVVAL